MPTATGDPKSPSVQKETAILFPAAGLPGGTAGRRKIETVTIHIKQGQTQVHVGQRILQQHPRANTGLQMIRRDMLSIQIEQLVGGTLPDEAIRNAVDKSIVEGERPPCIYGIAFFGVAEFSFHG